MLCAICHHPIPDTLRKGSKYCSDGCRKKARAMKARQQRAEQRSVLICPACGKAFKQKILTQKFCSAHCKQVYHDTKEKRGYTAFTCAICGKEFYSGVSGPHMYCSDECRLVAKRRYYENLFVRLHKCATPGCEHRTRNKYCWYCREKHGRLL